MYHESCVKQPTAYDCPHVATQERFEFLAKYRHVVPEEDFEVAMRAYEWPKKFVSIMKEAATKATSGLLPQCFASVKVTISCLRHGGRCPLLCEALTLYK